MVFKMGPTPELVNTVVLDVSPAVLIPFYDEDSRTLFLSSKVSNVFHFSFHFFSDGQEEKKKGNCFMT